MGIENQHINPFLQDRENENREKSKKNTSKLKSFARNAATAVGLGVVAISAQEQAQASHLDIAKAQTEATMAQFDAEHPKATKAERKAALLKAQVAEAEAKDLDQREQAAKPDRIGVAPKNEAKIKGTMRRERIPLYNEKGEIVGYRESEELSGDMMKHQENLAKKQKTIVVDPEAGVVYGPNGPVVVQRNSDRPVWEKPYGQK